MSRPMTVAELIEALSVYPDYWPTTVHFGGVDPHTSESGSWVAVR